MELSNITPEQAQVLKEKIESMSPEELREFQKKQCVFCHIIAGRTASKKIYEDDKALAILDINPASVGHILLLPKEHYTILPQIPEEIVSHLFMVTKALSHSILRALQCQGTTIFIANGIAAGQKAQHFMIHIIPRFDKDDVGLDLPEKSFEKTDIETVRTRLLKNIEKTLRVIKEEEIKKPEKIKKIIPRVMEAEFEEVKEKPIEKKSLEKTPVKKKIKKRKKSIKLKEEKINLDEIAKVLGVKK